MTRTLHKTSIYQSERRTVGAIENQKIFGCISLFALVLELAVQQITFKFCPMQSDCLQLSMHLIAGSNIKCMYWNGVCWEEYRGVKIWKQYVTCCHC